MGLKSDISIYKFKNKIKNVELSVEDIIGVISWSLLNEKNRKIPEILKDKIGKPDLETGSIHKYLSEDPKSKFKAIYIYTTNIKIEIEDFFNIEKSEIDWENYKYGKMVSSISILSVNNSTYAICTGFGIHKIKSLLQPNLGIEFIKRLKNGTKNIKKQSEVTVGENNNRTESYYLEPVDLLSVSSFENKVKKEIIASIEKNQLVSLGIINEKYKNDGFENNRGKHTLLGLKNAITINSSNENVEELIKKLIGIDKVLNSSIKQEFLIAGIEASEELINIFTKSIMKDIKDKDWDRIYFFNSSKLNKICNFFVNKKYKKDVNTFEGLPSAEEFFSLPIVKSEINDIYYTEENNNKQISFFEIFKNITLKIQTREEVEYKSKQELEKFIHYIFNEDDKTYYYSEGEFYVFETNYITLIEEEYKTKINNINYELPEEIISKLFSYSDEKEGEYNYRYNLIDNSVCLDKKYLDPNKKYEIADFLIVEDEIVYLLHAKVGFGADLRALQKQIEIAENQFSLLMKNKTELRGNFEILLENHPNKVEMLKKIGESKDYCIVGVILGKSKEDSITSNSIQGKLAMINLMRKIDSKSSGKLKFIFLPNEKI